MASPCVPAALLFFLSLLAAGGAARPCKTLFISYTFSSSPSGASFSGSALEVSQISAAGDRSPPRFLAIYRLIPLRYYSYPSYHSSPAGSEPSATTLRLPARIQRPALPRPLASSSESGFVVSSLRERARDILVVVAGLLFGVGCAAIASATVYLAWYLISNRYEVCGSDGYVYLDEVDDEIESPKKMGYGGLPAMPASPVAPLKEGAGEN